MLAERQQHVVHGRLLAPDFDVIALRDRRSKDVEAWRLEARRYVPLQSARGLNDRRRLVVHCEVNDGFVVAPVNHIAQ